MACAAGGLDGINNKIRQQLFRKGTRGLSGVARVFRQADFNGNKKLDKDEFEEAMSFAGLFLTKAEVSKLFQSYDRDGDGNINYEELLHGIQLPLSKPRREMVEKAFAILDRDQSGLIDSTDLEKVYDASKHPDVQEGKRTAKEVTEIFLNGFETGKIKDGKVTQKEFFDYYTDLGASIPSDAYFVQMMQSCWKISPEGAEAAATNMGRMLGLLRQKVTQKTKTGGNVKRKLKTAFQHFDGDESGKVTKDEFRATMEHFGIVVNDKEIEQFYTDYAGEDGLLGYDEFTDALELV